MNHYGEYIGTPTRTLDTTWKKRKRAVERTFESRGKRRHGNGGVNNKSVSGARGGAIVEPQARIVPRCSNPVAALRGRIFQLSRRDKRSTRRAHEVTERCATVLGFVLAG